MVNITKLTEDYIVSHPLIKDSLKRGLINYSALTRQICNDLNLDSKKHFDAILIACRRLYSKLKKEPLSENKILDILKKSKIEVKNKIVVFVLEKSIAMNNLLLLQKEAKKQMETFHIIEGVSAITVSTSEEFSKDISRTFKTKVIKKHENLVEVVLKSPKEIENVTGVISYLYSLLGENNVNIVETLSCWTDTIFLLEEKDLSTAMTLLHF